MKNKLIGITVALLISLLFIPLLPLAVKILYYLDVAFAFIILEICIFTVFTKEKIIPAFLKPLLACFTLYTISLYIATSKFLISLKYVNNPILSDFSKSFLLFPYSGYIIFVALSVFPIVSLFKKSKAKNEILPGIFSLLRASIKLLYIVFLASVIGGTFGDMVKDNMSFMDSFLLHLPFSCAQITSYLLVIVMVGVGIDTLSFVDNVKKKHQVD
ncbi:MAG: hypothetical protein J5710_07340 [Treponema sp.]|nr:hypothetical protein [Treponema sp.]